jgi:hypothetical protein
MEQAVELLAVSPKSRRAAVDDSIARVAACLDVLPRIVITVMLIAPFS